MRKIYGLLLSCLCMCGTNAQTFYRTEIFNPKRIKTLQVKQPDEIFTVPVITLGTDEQIEINFDDMTPNYERYAYSIIHCDADWKPSSLNQLEYLNGFQGLTIDDFASSFNTTVQYTSHKSTSWPKFPGTR